MDLQMSLSRRAPSRNPKSKLEMSLSRSNPKARSVPGPARMMRKAGLLGKRAK
jgi:hypothetical protein